MFNNNLIENSGIKSNNEIEWERMNLLCESFFNANCLNDENGMKADGCEISGNNCQENINLSKESRPFISEKYAESNSNINNQCNSFFEKTDRFYDKNPASTDLIELSLTDSDYLRAKNRWYDFSETELDFASAERMHYINLLTECFSNRNFGEHFSSHVEKSSSNLDKPLTNDHMDSRLFSKKQDMPRKFEFCVGNDEESKHGEGDCDDSDNLRTEHPVLKTNDCASVVNPISFGAKSTTNNNYWPTYQTHPRGDHLIQCHNNDRNIVTNVPVFRLELEGARLPSENVMKRRSLPEKEITNSVCCMRSQTENEEIRKRLENLERIMLAKINSYNFGNGCESPMLIGEQIGPESSIPTNKVKFPCRKFGLHEFNNLETSRKSENGGKSLERQKVLGDEGENKFADETRTNGRKPRSLKCKENELKTNSANRRKDSLDDLGDSQMVSFADSWSEFEIENIFENNLWPKGSSTSSSKRSYVTSDYTLIRRRKKYHRGKRRGRNRQSGKDETLEKYCHETDKRRAVSEKHQPAVKSNKAFSTDGKGKRYHKEDEIQNTQTTSKGSRIKQYCVIL